jgi:FlaA1/EpsC-like NDP-sugar epimerase
MEILSQQEQELLLGRRVEALLTTLDRRALGGRRYLITGAGGSVGGELARQIAACRPSLVVLVDHSEHALFRIEQELKECAPVVSLQPVLADITRAATTQRIVRRFRPHVVFHAAAYKHVTMAERAACATARVNVLGTWATLKATRAIGAQFVLISSDKAAAPRSVMGATKRLAELITLSQDSTRVARSIVVRFGNILASSGSFVETMRERIREGRPLLVTDPDATRFFMTVTEAAALVMKASLLARGGETFWLDMGEQVRIGDLAERLIETATRAGLPSVPIAIVGLRPGEKRVEQLAAHGISMRRTANPRIWVARQPPVPSALDDDWLRDLRAHIDRDDAVGTLRRLTEVVSDFEPSDHAWEMARAAELPGSIHPVVRAAVRTVA